MLTRKMVITVIVAVFVSMSGTASGTQYYVDPNGSDDANGLSWATAFATIQKGIDANNCVVVEVNEGTYYENINFNGVSCTVRSTAPNDWDVVAETIIDANDESTAVLLTSGEDANSILKGFTIRSSTSSGVRVSGSSTTPVISNCIIENNSYGVWCILAAPTVMNNIIRENTNGISCISSAAPTIINNWIYNNITGVFAFDSGSTVLKNNTIVGHSNYGIIAAVASPTISNCILWDNGDDLYALASATYSCIEDVNDANGIGNITSDPLFVDADANDFHLAGDSPCINTGDPNGDYTGQTDIDGDQRVINGRVDMGADEALSVFNLDSNKWYDTIQAAINDSNNGDEIVARAKTYYENVNFGGKSVTLRSTDPNDWDIVAATIIDANDPYTADGIMFDSGEDANSILKGFTVRNAYAGVFVDDGWPVISKCILHGNSVGVKYTQKSTGTLITNSKIYNNSSYGVYGHKGDAIIKNNWVYDNGIGVKLVSASADIYNNTIVNNDTFGVEKGGGQGQVTISNCIIWDNDGNDLYGCSATYSCIKDPNDANGMGNISSYPYFADYDANDFHLTWNSPCINRGNPNFTDVNETDIDGDSRIIDSRVDMGADEFAAHVTNLVPNPGFEDGNDAQGVPLYWVDQWASLSKSLDSTEKHSGDYSWKFVADGNQYSGAYSYLIAVNPNKIYKLSAWIKCETGNERVFLGWEEYDANQNSFGWDYFVLSGKTIPTEWTRFYGFGVPRNPGVAYVRLRFFGPYESSGTVWWDDFSLTEQVEFLPPYGCVNEPNVVETIDFGASNDDDPNYTRGIVWNSSAMRDPCTDSNDTNITYRELKPTIPYITAHLTIKIPAFNVDPNYNPNDPNDPNSLPLTPMLLEIMYKDTYVDDADIVVVASNIGYIDPDPNYLIPNTKERRYDLGHLGGYDDDKWKYFQYAFRKSYYQLLRAIDGVFEIRIYNNTDVNFPIDYVSLRKITQEEYKALTNKQRELRGFYEVEMPANNPDNPSYDDPNLVVFVRDIMRPVYKHTKPGPNEPNSITAFSCWGEIEPVSFSIYSESGVNDLGLTVEVNDLVHSVDSNNVIDNNNISIYHVVYDETRLGYDSDVGLKVSYALVPDRLEEFSTLSIDANSSKRVWLKIEVPGEDANLSSGLYEGNVTIKRTGEPNVIVPIDFTVYDITLDSSKHTNPIYHDPYYNWGTRVYSNDSDKVFQAYSETGFDPFIYTHSHRILVSREDPNFYDPNNLVFDSNNFEQYLDRIIDEGLVKDKAIRYIFDEMFAVHSYVLGYTLKFSDQDIWSHLSDPNFEKGMERLIDKYKEIGNDPNRNITFIFNVVDEPGTDQYKRILSDRIYTIVHDCNEKTVTPYDIVCDNNLPASDYNVPDNNIPSLTDLVDYKLWAMWGYNLDRGYLRHYDPNDPNYYGDSAGYFGYYTTSHSHWRNPVYNRFLHGLFAFGSDSQAVAAYAMGDYSVDPYNDFDAGATCIFPFTHPDFLFAYPTWSGELLYTIGGLEGIREGIKDAKYIATLERLIDEDPNDPNAIAANEYLVGLKSSIDPNYTTAYSNQSTELGYYKAILEDISDTNDNDPNDFEAFTKIRKSIADYIMLLKSE